MNATNPARRPKLPLKAAGALAAAGAVLLLGASLARSAAPAGQYIIDASAGTVADVETGLMWHREATHANPTYSNAESHCRSVGTMWRLPTVLELLSLVDHSIASGAKIDPDAFPSQPAAVFWTSTPCDKCGAPNSPYYAIDFANGIVVTRPASGGNALHVRCVWSVN